MASNAPGMRPAELIGVCNKLVFHHIPKTAGTTLHAELAQLFPQHKICPERYDNLHKMNYDELNSYDFFSGHFDFYQIGLIPGPKRVITFLREPKERIISLYYFWKSFTKEWIEANNLYGPLLAKSLSLLDFLKSDDITVLSNVDNSLVRSFIGRSRPDDYKLFRGYDNIYFANTAFENLKRYTFVGFVEHFKEDLAELRAILGVNISTKARHLNNAAELNASNIREDITREVITSEIEAELERLTSIDSIFYRTALENRGNLFCPYYL